MYLLLCFWNYAKKFLYNYIIFTLDDAEKKRKAAERKRASRAARTVEEKQYEREKNAEKMVTARAAYTPKRKEIQKKKDSDHKVAARATYTPKRKEVEKKGFLSSW